MLELCFDRGDLTPHVVLCLAACSSHCQTCIDENNDGVMVCSTCYSYYKLNAGQCAACPANCLECSESNGAMVCSRCMVQNVLMDDKTCGREYPNEKTFNNRVKHCVAAHSVLASNCVGLF